MKELGLDGSSLDKLVSGGTGYQAAQSAAHEAAMEDEAEPPKAKGRRPAKPKVVEADELDEDLEDLG
jgi:hypothetical protein